jgi:hypothetical protein
MSDRILISHRGNTSGPNPNEENHPFYVQATLNQGIHVEIDLWVIDGEYFLGHDEPQYPVNKPFLTQIGLLVHCKNCEAVSALLAFKEQMLFFWHQEDDMTLTSHGYVWVYPGKPIPDGGRSVAVLPELHPEWDLTNAVAICTDYVYQ